MEDRSGEEVDKFKLSILLLILLCLLCLSCDDSVLNTASRPG